MGKKSRRIKPANVQMPYVARSFESLPHEPDWVAMREIVPAATATVQLRDNDTTVRMCSLLPGAGSGLVRSNGEILVGLQVSHNYGDVSRDIAHAIEIGLNTEPGSPIIMQPPGPGARLQDLLDPHTPFDVQVHDGFDYWLGDAESDEHIDEVLEQANEAISPTKKIPSVDGAYATQVGQHSWLRWVQEHDEDDTLNALARLRADSADTLGADTRLLGSFRAHGRIVPVWELDGGQDADDLIEPMSQFQERLGEALAQSGPLSPAARSARNSLANRQLTLR